MADVASSAQSDWTGYAALDAGGGERFAAAIRDLAEGLRRWRAWSYLAMETVKNQYRRTVLGPWWLTLQTAAYVVGLAVIFSQILNEDVKNFLPYVAVGIIGFNLLSGMTRAGAFVFVNAVHTMKSTRQPLSSIVLKDLAVEFIQFAHNMLIFLVFLAVGLVPLSPRILIALPMIFLIAVNGLFVAFWLGPAVARFRDIGPLVMSVLQVLVFFTPVFYRLQDLRSGSRHLLLGWNPFTYLLSVLRAPMIGVHVPVTYSIGAAAVTLANVVLGFVVFARVRSRLPYWVS